MITDRQRQIYEMFDNAESDVERWKVIRDNSEYDILVYLDNDETFAVFESEDEEEQYRYLMDFSGYIGWSEGVVSLLKSLGIKCEEV